MRVKYYLELDIEDEKTVQNLQAISDAERTTIAETLRNVLQNFFAQGGVTPSGGATDKRVPVRGNKRVTNNRRTK